MWVLSQRYKLSDSLWKVKDNYLGLFLVRFFNDVFHPGLVTVTDQNECASGMRMTCRPAPPRPERRECVGDAS